MTSILARILRLSSMVFVCVLGAGPCVACKVPVFRYALERWAPNPYRAVAVYHRADQRAEVERLIAPLRDAGAGSLTVEVVDAGALTDAELWQFGDLEGLGGEPLLRLYLPPETGVEDPIWEAVLDAENVALALDSPARQRLVELLLGGASAVWVCVSGADPKAVDAVESRLREELARVESETRLPEGVLRASDLLSGVADASGVPVDLDDVLRTDIPFRIDFPVLRIDRSDPREGVFLAMLSRGHAGPARATDEGFVVPVFGRGRMIEPLPASRVDASHIARACAYLCGECSCQVKDDNPGTDLLLAVDWTKRLRADITVVERALAALPGAVKPETVTFGAAAPANPPVAPGAPALPWYLGGGTALVLGFLGVGALVRRRAGRKP